MAGETRVGGPLGLRRGAAHVVADMVLVATAYLLAYGLRFDFAVPGVFERRALLSLPFVLVAAFVFFARLRVFAGLWRFVSIRDVVAVVKAKTMASLVVLVAVPLLLGYWLPRSVLLLDWFLCCALVVGMRLGSRALHERKARRRTRGLVRDDPRPRKRAIVVGAGEGAEALIRQGRKGGGSGYAFVGLVDDDPRMRRRSIHGVRVRGRIDELPALCRSLEVDEILIAIPSATTGQRRRILELCRASEVPVRSVPTLRQLLEGTARVGELQKVDPEDVLGREPVSVDLEILRQAIQGRTVLITGAGGSIGSELCRQLGTLGPEKMVLYERAESALHLVAIELQQRCPDVSVVSLVGDVLDVIKVREVMRAHAPDFVYHAAAYKHVHLMEAQPLDAISNNVFGTEIVAQAALDVGVGRFVLVSTDKAVRPVGVMGRTKRVAEDLLLSFDGGETRFISVRFGNVLGSDGSVMPTFERQIARREPVTITDPAATRYFMLLAEAAQLVLQASVVGQGGEVLFLDMGEPMKIIDLAEGLILLSGLKPGEDIPVVIIGLRPGERVSEELVQDMDELLPSAFEKIFILRNEHFDGQAFRSQLETLRRATEERDESAALEQLEVMTASATREVIKVADDVVEGVAPNGLPEPANSRGGGGYPLLASRKLPADGLNRSVREPVSAKGERRGLHEGN
jgi:FlaA1/EpsC-like NDP-sugar epimerase